MAKFILDTNAVISLIENNNKKVIDNFRKALELESDIFITILNYYEFLRGINAITNVKGRTILEKYLKETITVIESISLDDARRASKIYQEISKKNLHRKKGKGPGDVDILMTSIALRLDAIIVSHDDDFKGIKGLKIQNWEI